MSQPDPLGDLREQIRSATVAAERLVRDVGAARASPSAGRRAEAGGAAGRIPEAGWHQAEADGGATEMMALGRLLAVLREVLPAELEQQATDLVRQLLVLLRALIDWAVTRLEQDRRGREVEVEDIPIA